MTRSPQILILIVVAVLVAPPVGGLECYVCEYKSGDTDTSCSDDAFDKSVDFNSCNGACLTRRTVSSDESVIVRECSANCRQRIYTDTTGGTSSTYCCTKDKCNAGKKGKNLTGFTKCYSCNTGVDGPACDAKLSKTSAKTIPKEACKGKCFASQSRSLNQDGDLVVRYTRGCRDKEQCAFKRQSSSNDGRNVTTTCCGSNYCNKKDPGATGGCDVSAVLTHVDVLALILVTYALST